MAEKKKPGRFTLQFNMEDPQQRTASELLEQQGRHKAQFIASAVLSYVQSPKHQKHSGDPSTVDPAILEKMLLDIMKKHPQFSTVSFDGPPETEEPAAPVTSAKGPWKDPVEDTAINAIFDTLAAFQTG